MKKIFFIVSLLCGFNASCGVESTQANLLKSFGIGAASVMAYSVLAVVTGANRMHPSIPLQFHAYNVQLGSIIIQGILVKKTNLSDLSANYLGVNVCTIGLETLVHLCLNDVPAARQVQSSAAPQDARSNNKWGFAVTGVLTVGAGVSIYNAIKNSSAKKTTPEVSHEPKK